ncbi:tricorn protease [Filimonas lacunae]|uniref:Tricorn protease homolog n=1 Tax=Filimonas lacunae TaxID=477680 RepID=A0A173MQZ4_9BACT|nr:S41 family peptidase [Filimonas lacunae]BAV10074.1 tolB protein precursor, periplasmic protein [Filimonas lacunae]SIS83600.1 tricorn protease [Filimonas lacunae]
MTKTLSGLALGLLFSTIALAQPDAGLFRFADVSETQIVFTYANDIWLIPKEGGQAIKITSPPGVESFPKFSPDGKTLAFTGNYDGNKDVYVLPVSGGVPLRLTQHGYTDRVVDWTPDGKKVIFASIRESTKERFNQFYTIAATGGSASKLPLAYAEFGSYSPDGKKMAVAIRTQAFRSWKRYRGGMKANIHIFDFTSLTSVDISADDEAGDEFPMWHDQFIYFLSDRGQENRMNLWRYNVNSKATEQLTHFKDFDVHFPSLGPSDIVYEAGGKLYLYSLAKQQATEVKVNITTDQATLRPRLENVKSYLQNISISPDGKRILASARGDIFSLPAEEGYVKNLTHTSGIAERYPEWSPDGSKIAYWSDASGEYELYLQDAEKETAPQKLTSYGAGFRYSLFWSPDSKKLAFIDKTMRIYVYDISTKTSTEIDRALYFMHGALENFRVSWSPDSRWIAYARDLKNPHEAIFIYDYTNKKAHQVTSGFYTSTNPVFDKEGKYLFLFTNQAFNPTYSDLDNTFVYANATQVAAISLSKSTPSLLYARNDSVNVKKEGDTKGKEDDAKKTSKAVNIDFDDIESRLVVLPLAAGNYANLTTSKGKLLYVKQNNTGAAPAPGAIKYFDIEEREEKTILPGVTDYALSADGQKLLVPQNGNWAVVKVAENQKIDKLVPTGEMKATVDPKQEWKQLFTEAWRLERDYFYDPNLHGVNWPEAKERYAKILEHATTREEVNFIIGELIGELNSSHTYYGGGDVDKEKSTSVGYLGIDWQPEGQYYKIKKILRGASWDAEIRSPFDLSGADIKEGDFILAVNGIPITTAQEPFAAFQDLAGKTVEITYSSTASLAGAKTVTVKTLGDEYRLRHLAWIESNRKRVAEASNGEVGYIFVPSTGIDGQNELIRQYNAQWEKKALVIDERFNNGGQIPDRFIELLNRKPIAYWTLREGNQWPWPPYAHFGPKVMLINGWSGSGGDAFPDFFRKAGLGPIIGTRTWGGLIGLTGAPELIDGGEITVPTFRMYNLDGTWFKEGHGVDPDIYEDENLGQMAKGIDVQLERAISTVKELIKTKGFTPPASPGYEKR